MVPPYWLRGAKSGRNRSHFVGIDPEIDGPTARVYASTWCQPYLHTSRNGLVANSQRILSIALANGDLNVCL